MPDWPDDPEQYGLQIPARPGLALGASQAATTGGRPRTASSTALDRLLEQYFAAPATTPWSEFKSLFLGGPKTRNYMTEQVKTVGPLLNLQRQEERLALETEVKAREQQTKLFEQQRQLMEGLRKNALDFQGLSPLAQEEMRPWFIAHAVAAGFTPVVAKAAFSLKDFAPMAAGLRNDLGLSEEQRTELDARVQQARNPDEALKFVKEFRDEQLLAAKTTLKTLIPGYVAQAGGSPEAPVGMETLRQVAVKKYPTLSQSPIFQQAWAGLEQEPEALMSLGVLPGKIRAEITGEREKQKASAAGKLETVQGRAELKKLLSEIDEAEARKDLVAAQTAKAKMDTWMAGYKVIPGAGGAIIRVPTGPTSGTGVLAGERGTGAPETGQITAAPGVSVIASTPGPGLSSAAVEDIVRGEKAEAALERIGALRQKDELRAYVGPRSSRPVAAMRQLLEERAPGMKLPDNFVRLQQGNAQLKNFIIVDVTGAAVKRDEEPRILAEIPDIATDKWDAFWIKWDQSLATMKAINQRKKEMYGPDGRLKAGADLNATAKRYPLPPPLDLGKGSVGRYNPATDQVERK